MARRKLENCGDIKRYLSYLIRQTQAKKVSGNTAGKLGYLCSILIKCIESSDLEARLSKLEEKITK